MLYEWDVTFSRPCIWFPIAIHYVGKQNEHMDVQCCFGMVDERVCHWPRNPCIDGIY